jgi:hypothetical protein
MTDREPVAQMLNSVLMTLDDIAVMANNPDTTDDVVAEEIALGQILSRTQLILSFIRTKRPVPNKVWRVS